MSNQGPFDTLHHVCIVVHDIQQSEAYYESIGVGPWQDYPSLDVYKDVDVPDRDAFMELQFKVVNLGNFQLQLCQPGMGNTPQRAFLDERGEGVFHLGFDVSDCDSSEENVKSLGAEVLMRGRLQNRSGFTFFNTASQGAGVTLEIRASKSS